MRTEIVWPMGLPTDMEDYLFDYGLAFTEWLADTYHLFLITGAFRDEIHIHTDVRMK